MVIKQDVQTRCGEIAVLITAWCSQVLLMCQCNSDTTFMYSFEMSQLQKKISCSGLVMQQAKQNNPELKMFLNELILYPPTRFPSPWLRL